MPEDTPPEVRWKIPPNVWVVLVTWGLAVLMLTGMFSLRIYLDQRSDHRRDAEQDKALCEVITFSLQTPPTIPPGPEGERVREGLAIAERLRKATCE